MTRWSEADLVAASLRLKNAGKAIPTTAAALKATKEGQDSGSVPIAAQKPSNAVSGKYRNVPKVVDGVRYASKLEARCAEWLSWRQKAGEIAFYIRQPRFVIEGGEYIADFATFVTAERNQFVLDQVIDAKGRDTPGSRKSRRQVLERYGIEVELWPGSLALPEA